MTAVALRGLAGRKFRATLTALAIVLGVAMISGTYVLTDTIDKAFSNIFTTIYEDTDAVITGESAFGDENDFVVPPPFSESLLAEVQRLPGVAVATGSVSDSAQLTNREATSSVAAGHRRSRSALARTIRSIRPSSRRGHGQMRHARS